MLNVVQRWFPSNNNNFGFSLERFTGAAANVWGKLIPIDQGFHPPTSDAEKKDVDLYSRSVWLVEDPRQSMVPFRRRVVCGTRPPCFSIQTYRTTPRNDFGLRHCRVQEPILLALGRLVSVFDWLWLMRGGGWWVPSNLLSACVCVVLYRCVCLLSFMRLLPSAGRWYEADDEHWTSNCQLDLAVLL